MYVYAQFLTICWTSKAFTPHNALCMMWVPLRAFRCLSYAALLSETADQNEPCRRKRHPALSLSKPSAARFTFISCEYAYLGANSAGSSSLSLGQWHNLHDWALSQQKVSASGWSEKMAVSKMRVRRQRPSAHCRTLVFCVRVFHPSKRAWKHWCVIWMRRRNAPIGPSSVLNLVRVAFFLSKTGIIPTTSQLPGSARTSSWMQPRDTANQGPISVLNKKYQCVGLKIYVHIHTFTYVYVYICTCTNIYVQDIYLALIFQYGK